MRVLVAPDAFTGVLGPGEVAAAMAGGWLRAAPDDTVTQLPLSDGGPGFLDVLAVRLGGELVPVTVSGPFGEPVPATVLVVPDAEGTDDFAGSGPTAYVEVAQACGLHLVAAQDRDPARATSYGAGELVAHALASGARRVVVGVGGTATNDGGAGLLAALGTGPRELLGRGGLALAGLDGQAVAGLDAARSALSGVDVVLASASDGPLLGFHGTSATYAQDKGATPEQAQQLEAALGHFAHLATWSSVARPLVGAGPHAHAGAGAGGGIGFALLLLGATRIAGVRAVADAVGLADEVAGSDLVLTGEARFDWTSLRGGVVAEVAARGLDTGIPVVVVPGEALVGRRESMALGLSGVYPVIDAASGPRSTESAQLARSALASTPAQSLADRTARVARTWSRGASGRST